MSTVVLGELLDTREKEIEAIGKAVMTGHREEAIANLAGLATTVLTAIPGLGGLVREGVAQAFASPANAVLERQIEEWNREQDARRQRESITDAVEILLGQALIQVIRSQRSIGDELIQALGGLREELTAFRAQVDAGLAGTVLHVAVQEVSEAAVGISVRQRTRQRVVIGHQLVRGHGTTGIVLG